MPSSLTWRATASLSMPSATTVAPLERANATAACTADRDSWLAMVAIRLPEMEETRSFLDELYKQLGWKYRIVPDIPGMISGRILAMIINEAYYTLQENVSTREEIDIAMKLGTNYPFGPFEWSEKIGLENIYDLLNKLGATDDRYMPAMGMVAAIANVAGSRVCGPP